MKTGIDRIDEVLQSGTPPQQLLNFAGGPILGHRFQRTLLPTILWSAPQHADQMIITTQEMDMSVDPPEGLAERTLTYVQQECAGDDHR